MMKLEFEWHDAKAQANWRDHGVSFELAKTVFKDPFAIERVDDRENYGEDRFVVVGMGAGHLLIVLVMTRTQEAYDSHFGPCGNTRMPRRRLSGNTLVPV